MRIAVLAAAACIATSSHAQGILSGAGGRITFRPTDTLAGTMFHKDTVKGAPVWLSPQMLLGTPTNDNAAAGMIGEYLSHSTVTGSSLSLTTVTTATIDSLTLTAGDWDVTGVIDFTFGATTSITNLTGGLSTTRSALGGQDQSFDHRTAAIVPTAANDAAWVVPTTRFSIASTTKVYLVVQGAFTVSTLKAYGTIRARRMR